MWSWGHSELAGTLLCQQHQHLQWKVGVLSWAKASRPPAPTMEQQEGRGAALPSRRGLLGGPSSCFSPTSSLSSVLWAHIKAIRVTDKV